jgi:general stress protein 26
MPTPQELKDQLWKAVASDRTMMLGLEGVSEGYPRPMSAQLEGDHGPIWFFTSKDAALAQLVKGEQRAFATFADKGHDLFATLHGRLSVDNDRAMIDKLWNRFVAAWFEQGKSDPKLVLLRFDAEHAEIWSDASSLVAGIKMLLGVDPKKDYKDKVADVPLS